MKKIKIELTKDQKRQVESKSVASGYCKGCTQTTPNGHCYVVDGVCKWIPEIG